MIIIYQRRNEPNKLYANFRRAHTLEAKDFLIADATSVWHAFIPSLRDSEKENRIALCRFAASEWKKLADGKKKRKRRKGGPKHTLAIEWDDTHDVWVI